MWNYRIGAKTQEGATSFSIIEVYYDDDKQPYSYTEPCVLSNWDGVDSLKYTHQLVEGAFSKSVLDLENWPNEYKP